MTICGMTEGAGEAPESAILASGALYLCHAFSADREGKTTYVTM